MWDVNVSRDRWRQRRGGEEEEERIWICFPFRGEINFSNSTLVQNRNVRVKITGKNTLHSKQFSFSQEYSHIYEAIENDSKMERKK